MIDRATWEVAQAAERDYWFKNLASIDEETAEKAHLPATYASCLIWGRLGYFPTAFKGKTVIDIGCGPTERCSCLIDVNLIGIDPLGERYLDLPGRRLRSYSRLYAQAAEERIDALIETADVVVCLNCLDHCYDAKAVIENMAAYMKSDGIGILSTDVEYAGQDAPDRLHPLRMTSGDITTLILAAGLVPHSMGRCSAGDAYPMHNDNGEIEWWDGWSGGKSIAHHWRLRKAG